MDAKPRKVNFPSNGINIVGELYNPIADTPSRKSAAVVIGYSAIGVKEQTAATYARMLAAAGFFALTFDTIYQGESGGSPHGLENPFHRAEDVPAAVSYLPTLAEVDEAWIEGLGICASGSYVPFAAQTDTLMKAVATVSTADIGRLANTLRTLEAKDGETRISTFLLEDRADILPTAPDLTKEGWDCYRTPRGAYPRSTGVWVARSVDLCANFDAHAVVEMISLRLLLTIAGEKAGTQYLSEEAVATAREPKEMFCRGGVEPCGSV